jgi:SAM-dependent methyltransferase
VCWPQHRGWQGTWGWLVAEVVVREPGVKHPAKWSQRLLDQISDILTDAPSGARVLDPFAGIGLDRLREIRPDLRWHGIEIEPEWAKISADTIVGDATRLPHPDATFDLVLTSPTYGNRMADTYDGRDGSRRMTYRLALGRELTDGSTAGMQWGPSYRYLHDKALDEILRVLRVGGTGIINMSNHIRGGAIQLVVEWWTRMVVEHGCQLISVTPVDTPRHRHGANHEARVEAEHLITFRKISPHVRTLF